MNIEKINPNIKYIYHYTLKKNVNKIMKEQVIISKDQYVFFTMSLNDSITAFEREMMQENKLYIDVNGVLRRREKCNKNDYCILKIPYKNDNQFYKFNFENQSKESIYTISISHKGSYQFEKAKVLEFPKIRKSNVLTKTAVAAIATGIILFPYNIYAASWLDTNNYDTSWYSSSTTNYKINTAKEMAGLAHLVNNENVKFDGKNIEIMSDIDLTENTWETIKSIFKGNICGSHRIILNCLDGKFIENKEINIVDYSYKVLVDDINLKKVNVKRPYTVEKLKEVIGTYTTVFFNNEKLSDDKSLLELKLGKNDIIEVFHRYNYIKNSSGVKVPFEVESGDSIDFVREKYSKKTNIPKERIILKYGDKELQDGRTLADYNIQKHEIIDAYVVNTNVEDGKGSINISKDTTVSGTEITITLEPEAEYKLEKITVNGIDKTSEAQNNELKIEFSDEDITVKVSYKLKKEVIENPKEDIKKEDNKESEQESKLEDNTEKDIKSEVITKNPKTGDNIVTQITALITSTAGICIMKLKNIRKR